MAPHNDSHGVTDQGGQEQQRILLEYTRRDREVAADLYAPWQPASGLLIGTNRRIAAQMLERAGVFPRPTSRCLEIGPGSSGWLSDLIGWGVRERHLSAIDLDGRRINQARQLLPTADLRVGDAAHLPWNDGTFDLVIASTVFTSILDAQLRRDVAREIERVLAPGGALLWYDFSRNNPSNKHVRKVSRGEVRTLFAGLKGELRSVTLAPPIARTIAPISWILATVLEAIPLLRTHLIGVLVKPRRA
jgi:SAM-dependent methyltransferase